MGRKKKEQSVVISDLTEKTENLLKKVKEAQEEVKGEIKEEIKEEEKEEVKEIVNIVEKKIRVRKWVKQEPVIIDLNPLSADIINGIFKENEKLKQQFENNLYAIRKIYQGIIEHYKINVPNLDAIKVKDIPLENGKVFYQLVVDQSDKLIEVEE